MDAKTAIESIDYAIGVMEGEGCRVDDIDNLHLAIDFIEQQAKDAELGQAMQWISVNERLPENDSQILVTDGISVEKALMDCDIGFVVLSSSEMRSKQIKHWMPIPPVPEIK